MAKKIPIEDFFGYKELLLDPEASKIFKDMGITKDNQLGNLDQKQFEKIVFGFGLASLCLNYKSTRKYGLHVLMEIANMLVTSNSIEGFLRKEEHESIKITRVGMEKKGKFVDRFRA